MPKSVNRDFPNLLLGRSVPGKPNPIRKENHLYITPSPSANRRLCLNFRVVSPPLKLSFSLNGAALNPKSLKSTTRSL